MNNWIFYIKNWKWKWLIEFLTLKLKGKLKNWIISVQKLKRKLKIESFNSDLEKKE